MLHYTHYQQYSSVDADPRIALTMFTIFRISLPNIPAKNTVLMYHVYVLFRAFLTLSMPFSLHFLHKHFTKIEPVGAVQLRIKKKQPLSG